MYPPVLAVISTAVKIREVRAISRKDRIGMVRNPQRLYARRSEVSNHQIEEKVRTVWRHTEAGRNVRSPSKVKQTRWVTKLSEIPCRVSNIARGGSDPVQITGSNRWSPPGACRSAAGNTEGKIVIERSP